MLTQLLCYLKDGETKKHRACKRGEKRKEGRGEERKRRVIEGRRHRERNWLEGKEVKIRKATSLKRERENETLHFSSDLCWL